MYFITERFEWTRQAQMIKFVPHSNDIPYSRKESLVYAHHVDVNVSIDRCILCVIYDTKNKCYVKTCKNSR